MRAPCVALALALCLCAGALGVQVKVGDRSFPLEAVKQLKELMKPDGGVGPRLAGPGVTAVCAHPQLPPVFQPVCREEAARVVLSRLAHIIRHVDHCELCAYPSCSGCLQ